MKIIQVVHAIKPASKPDDYILEPPIGMQGEALKAILTVKCPFGPIVLWAKKSEISCTFCDGDGCLDIKGRNGTYKEIDCPECDGEATTGEYIHCEGSIWADSYGHIVEPEMVPHNGYETISERWLQQWAMQQQSIERHAA